MTDDRTANLDLPLPHEGNLMLEDVARLRAALDAIDAAIHAKQAALGFTPEDSAKRGVAGGYAPLDENGLVPAENLPSYADDVLEYDDLDAFPGFGEAGKLYVAKDTSRVYRWDAGGEGYVLISVGTTDDVAEGSENLYFTEERARNAQYRASPSVLGLVRVGDRLSVDANGVVSADPAPFSSITDKPTTLAGYGITDAALASEVVPKSGGAYMGPIEVPAGASGAQVPRASEVVHMTGAETIAGVKTFSDSPVVPAGASGSQVPRASEIFGKGQTKTAVSRTKGATYTNSTGKPFVLLAIATVPNNNGSLLYVEIDGAAGGFAFWNNSGDPISMNAVIPTGSTYKIDGDNIGSLTVYEYR